MAIQVTLPNGDVISVDGVATEDTLKNIQKQLSKSTSTGNSGDPAKASKNLSDSMKGLDKNTKDLADNIDDLSKSTGNAADNIDDLVLKDKKAQAEQAKLAKDGLQNFNKEAKGAAKSFGQSLQSSTVTAAASLAALHHGSSSAADGISTTANVLNQGIGLASQGMQSAATAGQAAGTAMMALPGPTKIVGVALAGLASVAGMASGVLSGALQFANTFLSQEFIKTAKSFEAMSSSGAFFADGLTGMRTAAGQAGMTLVDYSAVVEKNSELLSKAGLGVADGVKKVGAVTAQIGKSGLREDLLRLGFSIQDQADITTQYIGDLSRAGSLSLKTNEQIAKETGKYAESLRIVSAITGEDAKKRMEEVRAQTMQIAVQNKLREMEAQQPGFLNRFNAALNVFPKTLQKGVIEQFVTGGSVIDRTTNIMMAGIPGIQGSLDQFNRIVNDSSLDTAQATSQASTAVADLSKSFNDSRTDMNAMGTAALLGVTGPAADTSVALTELNKELMSFSDQGVKNAVESVDAAKNAQDKVTSAYILATNEVNKFQLEVQKIATDLLPAYAGILGQAIIEMKKILGEAVSVASSAKTGIAGFLDKFDKAQAEAGKNAAIGAGVGASIGALGFGAGALPGAGLGAAAGYLSGLGTSLFEQYSQGSYANGGIAAGPTSGYMATLHGTEAVVPLPDSKSIPVSLNFGAIAGSLMAKGIASDISDAIVSTSTATTPTSSPNPTSDIVEALEEQCSYMKAMLDRTDQMIRNLEEQTRVSQQILNQTY